MSSFADWFWNSEFWLPPNVTWNDLKVESDEAAATTTTTTYANFNHLGYPMVIGCIIVLVRHLVETMLFRPLGKWLSIKEHRANPSRLEGSLALELEFKRSQSWSHDTIARLGRSLQAGEREVEVWLRYKRILRHPSKLDKFSETGWRWVFYTGIFIYGLRVLWEKPYFWDIVDCWVEYPFHRLDANVWWYYMIELSFYWCVFFSQFLGDIRRKDFWSMFLHHVATIALISFSWIVHLHKIGTLIMITHDVSDVFLESAKLFYYASNETMSNVFFAAFSVVWVITRMGVYPTWIIYSITVEAPQLVEYFPAYLFLNVLLSTLLGLNIYWTYFILKLSYVTLLGPSKSIQKDIRSQSSESSPSELENNTAATVEVSSKKDK